MRWRSRAVLVLAVAALLSMHGLDAASTAAHASHQPAAAADNPPAEHHAPQRDASPTQRHADLGHAAMACAAILLAVASVVAVRRAGERLRGTAERVTRSVSAALAALDAFGRPPPQRFATCVIRR